MFWTEFKFLENLRDELTNFEKYGDPYWKFEIFRDWSIFIIIYRVDMQILDRFSNQSEFF